MKVHFTRVFAMLAVPIFGVLISAVGCSSADVSDPAVAEEEAAISAEEESVSTEESALEEEEDEATAEGSFALDQARPRRCICYAGPNCRGRILATNVTLRQCKAIPRPRPKSWRCVRPPTRCIDP
jgi:hypothetical protein